MRRPQDWLLRAQIYLLLERRKLRTSAGDQQEWENLTEAVVVMGKCLKQVEKEKK